jgi:hypothetical protein
MGSTGWYRAWLSASLVVGRQAGQQPWPTSVALWHDPVRGGGRWAAGHPARWSSKASRSVRRDRQERPAGGSQPW